MEVGVDGFPVGIDHQESDLRFVFREVHAVVFAGHGPAGFSVERSGVVELDLFVALGVVVVVIAENGPAGTGEGSGRVGL